MCCVCKCAAWLIKLCIYAFNIVFWVVGLALFCYGIYLATEKVTSDYAALFGDLGTGYWEAVVGLVITLGILIICAGVLGCCGTFKDTRMLWLGYTAFMCLILAIQITTGSLAAVQQQELADYIDDNFEDQIKYDYGVPGQDDLTQGWNSLQADLKCCGANSYTDYKNSNYTNSQPTVTDAPPVIPTDTPINPVPDSCCMPTSDEFYLERCKIEAAVEDPHASILYTEGCIDALNESIDRTARNVYITMIAIAVCVCCSIVMGFCKCCDADSGD